MASQTALLDRSDKERLKEKLAISNFDPNAILRGMQLTIVGGECTCIPIVRGFSLDGQADSRA